MRNLIDDAGRNPRDEVIGEAGPVGGHEVVCGDSAEGDGVVIGAFIAHDADALDAGEDGEILVHMAVQAGEDDFLRKDNIAIKEEFNNPLFYDAKNEGELHMHHVFPIAHPEWPQSQKAIALIAENAVGRR